MKLTLATVAKRAAQMQSPSFSRSSSSVTTMISPRASAARHSVTVSKSFFKTGVFYHIQPPVDTASQIRARISAASQQFPHNPCHEKINKARLTFWRNGGALRNLPPFFEASTAACRSGMLGHKDGMPAHRRLTAIVRRVRQSKPCTDKILRMASNGIQTFLRNVSPIGIREMEPRPELRPRQLPECRFRTHLPYKLLRRISKTSSRVSVL